MNLNQGALMKAVGVGAGLGVVFGIGQGIPLVGIICCCLGILAFVAAGAAYGYFDQQEGRPADMQSWAIGGAISGAVAGLAWGVFAGIMNLVLQALGMSVSTYEQLETTADLDPQTMALLTGVGGIFICGCLGLIMDAVLGALGGLGYAALRRNQAPAQPPAM